MTEVDNTPADAPHEYVRFNSEAEFLAAIDRLLQLDGRELRIFDADLSALKFNSPERAELLRAFLAGSQTRRVFIVVHDPGHITRYCPRLMNLLALYSHAIQIHRTGEEIRELQDSFMVLDKNHYVRRPVARFFRGAAGVNDETEALVMRSRFQEIWNASEPAVSSSTSGL